MTGRSPKMVYTMEQGSTWPSSGRLVRMLLGRVTVQQIEQHLGSLGRAHTSRDDVAVLQSRPVECRVVIKILAQCGAFQGEAREQALRARPREDVRVHLRIRL